MMKYARIFVPTLKNVRNLGYFSTLKFNENTSSFPYKFGGLKDTVKIPPTDVNNKVLKEIVGEDVIDGFGSAYKSILTAFEEKDTEFLESVLEKRLLKGVKFPEVRLVNPSSPLKIRVGEIAAIRGGCFDRDKLSQNVMYNPQRKGASKDLNAYVVLGDNTDTRMILFAFKVYFVSKMKLVLVEPTAEENNAESTQNLGETSHENEETSEVSEQKEKQKNIDDEEEIHMIQFEVEAKHESMLSLVGSVFKLLLKSKIKRQDFSTQFARFLMQCDSPNFEWKVGDIDLTLQGNHPEIITKNE